WLLDALVNHSVPVDNRIDREGGNPGVLRCADENDDLVDGERIVAGDRPNDLRAIRPDHDVVANVVDNFELRRRRVVLNNPAVVVQNSLDGGMTDALGKDCHLEAL